MQVDQDLAALFSRHLTLQPTSEPGPAESRPVLYSVSQHYHHSSHVSAASREPEPGRAAECGRSVSAPARPTCEMLLAQHGVSPSSLSPSQLQLFRISHVPQQERLIQLWTVAPPNRGAEDPSLAWTTTTLDREEYLARLRYERELERRRIRERDSVAAGVMLSLDGTPMHQNGDGGWTALAPTMGDLDGPEPYMVAGYIGLASHPHHPHPHQAPAFSRDAHAHFGTSVGGPGYSQATDPVYMGPDYVGRQQCGDLAAYGPTGVLDAMDVM